MSGSNKISMNGTHVETSIFFENHSYSDRVDLRLQICPVGDHERVIPIWRSEFHSVTVPLNQFKMHENFGRCQFPKRFVSVTSFSWLTNVFHNTQFNNLLRFLIWQKWVMRFHPPITIVTSAHFDVVDFRQSLELDLQIFRCDIACKASQLSIAWVFKG